MAVTHRYTYSFLLLLVFAALLQACSEPQQESLIGSDGTDLRQVFTVESDESKPPYKRTVEVTLKHRVTESDLRLIAEYIKAAGRQKVDRTFISYRHLDQPAGSAYWATTHYTPDLKVEVMGLTPAQVQQLEKVVAAKGYKAPVASWLVEDGIPHLTVLHVKSGRVVMDEFYADGSSASSKVDAMHGPQELYVLKEKDQEEDEFDTVDAMGVMRKWSGDHVWLTLRPYSAVPVKLAALDAAVK